VILLDLLVAVSSLVLFSFGGFYFRGGISSLGYFLVVTFHGLQW
jgi:hypothetical protein